MAWGLENRTYVHNCSVTNLGEWVYFQEKELFSIPFLPSISIGSTLKGKNLLRKEQILSLKS